MGEVARADRRTLPALTALRFVAAAMIVIGHGSDQFGTAGLERVPLNQGVSFFFVLSGFILSYNYRAFDSLGGVWRFLVARFARIWPTHAACLLLFLAVLPAPLWYVPYPTPTFTTLLILDGLLVQAWIPYKQVILSLNGVAWSISDELFFYLVFPLLVVLRRRWPLVLGLNLVVFATTLFLVVQNGLVLDESAPGLSGFGLLYTNPLVRVLEFQCGVLTADAYLATRHLRFGRVGGSAAEAAALGLAFGVLLAIPGLSAWLMGMGGMRAAFGFWMLNNGAAPAFMVLIAVMARDEGWLSRALGARALTFLGEISFAVYLVHVVLLRSWALDPPLLAGLGTAARCCVFWAALLAGAALLHLVVERPCRRMIVARASWRARQDPV